MFNNKLDEIDLFYIRLKRGLISDNEKQRLYESVINLEERTISQKKRFILYYHLKKEQSEEYNYASLGRKEGCSSSAIRCSVLRVKHTLANLKGKRKNEFLDIVKSNDYLKNKF